MDNEQDELDEMKDASASDREGQEKIQKGVAHMCFITLPDDSSETSQMEQPNQCIQVRTFEEQELNVKGLLC